MNFKETSIPANYSMDLKVKAFMDWLPEDASKIYDTLIESISQFLGRVKSKDPNKKAALVVNDLKGNFKMAGILSLHENENKEMPDNWNYVLTFDAEDISDATDIYYSNSTEFEICVGKVAWNLHGMRFIAPNYIHDMCIVAIDTLLKYLDENASEVEEKDVDLPGYFKASVSVEEGKKVMAIVPGEAMKTVAKGDYDL